MKTIDINCDFGEGFGVYQLPRITEVLKYVSSVNIACGFHAGDPTLMREAVEQAIQHDVKIGAHPGYNDLVGFGRRDFNLSPQEVYDIILYQVGALSGYVNKYGVKLNHVKPHGALYNKAAKCEQTSKAIAQAVYDFSPDVKLYALANSVTVKIAREVGLVVCEEAFIDRTYEEDGSLTSRKKAGSVIEDEKQAVEQIMQIVSEQTVTTINDKSIPMYADTFCIHGDNLKAVQFAKSVFERLQKIPIQIGKG